MTIGDLYESISKANINLKNINCTLLIFPTGKIEIKTIHPKGSSDYYYFNINDNYNYSDTEDDLLQMIPTDIPIVYPKSLLDKDLYEDNSYSEKKRFTSKFDINANNKKYSYTLHFDLKLALI